LSYDLSSCIGQKRSDMENGVKCTFWVLYTLRVGLPLLHVYYDHSLKTFPQPVFPTLIRMLRGLYRVLVRPDL